MLTQLKTIDDELRQGIAELAALVSQSAADEEALSKLRIRLARLIGRRRAFIQCTILPTLHDISPSCIAQLADLRLDAAAWAVEFSEHISRWTRRAIRADPAGYKAASRQVRNSMLCRMDRDAAMLYPLIERRTGAPAK